MPDPTQPEQDHDDEYPDLDCTHCGGEGEMEGRDIGGDPGWYLPDEFYPCPACNGSGRRSQQVIF